ncbi:MAG: hypothetical protein WBF93_13160, partial [Pirellulales bacterium]
SKGAAELVVRSYRHSYFAPDQLFVHGVKLASARAGNVIGGGDWTSDALIVDIAKALAAGEPVKIRNPGAFRPWQHVLQALSGYLLLASRLLESDDAQYCSGWNIGPTPGNEVPVREIVDLFLGTWGSGSWVDVSNPSQLPEANILRLSIDKALWQLGWRPGWDVRETMQKTVEWYREFYAGQSSMREFSLNQINQYEDAIAKNFAAVNSNLATRSSSAESGGDYDRHDFTTVVTP